MPFIVAAILAYVLNPWVDKVCALRRFSISRSMASHAVDYFRHRCQLAMVLIIVPILQKEAPQLHRCHVFDKFDQLSHRCWRITDSRCAWTVPELKPC
jgi:hypothetical protein